MQKLFKKLLSWILLFIVFYCINYWLYLNNSNVKCSKIYGPDANQNKEDDRSFPPSPGEDKSSVPLSPGKHSDETKPGKDLPRCPDTSPYLLGPFTVEFNLMLTLDSVRKEHPGLQNGGRFKPQDCISSQKVAVIIPFRNRYKHLKYWLHYLHPILQRQQLDYGVYIINQHGEGTFNKAKLMNAGHAEALKEYDYDCFVFSDVDLIPMDDRNTYRCFHQPRHLAVAVDKFGFKLSYNTMFGGVTSLSKVQFLKINGFSNQYLGWGGEDDAIYKRLFYRGMTISRPNEIVGKYRMIKHQADWKNEPNPKRFHLMDNTIKTMDKDGINSLHYTVVDTKKDRLFTFITVNVSSSV